MGGRESYQSIRIVCKTVRLNYVCHLKTREDYKTGLSVFTTIEKTCNEHVELAQCHLTRSNDITLVPTNLCHQKVHVPFRYVNTRETRPFPFMIEIPYKF